MSAPQTPNTTSTINIILDGHEVTAKPDSYLLDIIKQNNINIPTLCHHKDLTPSGTCRLCVVEIEIAGKKKLVTACNYPVRTPLTVTTASPKVLKHRQLLAEMYLGRWPNVPIIQELAKQCGVTTSRFSSELTDDNPEACILCGHCVRACKEFIMEEILDFAGRGIKRHLTMPFGEMDNHCVGCTSCAYVCPTGAIKINDDFNKPHDAKLIRDYGMNVNAEMATLDKKQCRMREVGTANIVEVMAAYDLLPVHNYKFGNHPDVYKIDSKILKEKYLTQGMADGCWRGCSMACAKAIDNFVLRTGPYRGSKVVIDGPEYETAAAAANMGCFDGDFLAEFNFYCDTYGVDTISVGTTIAFVMECYENSIINKKDTGGLELKFGACDEVLTLLHQMAQGKGFGVTVGQGILRLKEMWQTKDHIDPQFLHDIGMELKGLEYSEYVSKESLAQQGGYAMAIKGPQHDEAWLIFMDMVNKQLPTFADKAEALYYFPLWRTWFGLMGLCKIVWNDVIPADNYREKEPAKVPGHVRNYFKFFEGMTGIPLNEETMLLQSARVYNLQRALSFMLGKGIAKFDFPPYRSMGPVTAEEYASRADRYDKQILELCKQDPAGKSTCEKIAILRTYRETQYRTLQEAVYQRRGWTKNGVPTIARLKELGIDLPEIVALVKDHQDT